MRNLIENSVFEDLRDEAVGDVIEVGARSDAAQQPFVSRLGQAARQPDRPKADPQTVRREVPAPLSGSQDAMQSR